MPSPKTRPLVAIVGSPNSGKSSLFNRLTGLRQKVANYPGVTVEKRSGECTLPSGSRVELLDLPGTYSLAPRSPDERIVREILDGQHAGTPGPDRVVAVLDATNLDRQLYLALQIVRAGRPAIVVLNLMDEAEARGIEIDVPALEAELGAPVLAVSAKTGRGLDRLRAALDPKANGHANGHAQGNTALALDTLDPTRGYSTVEEIVRKVVRRRHEHDRFRARLDRVLTHRILGPVIFVLLMATIFQSIYVWAQPSMELIEKGFSIVSTGARAWIPAGPLRSLIADGVIAGAGTVASFLPQLAILFFFIALLEDTGYMARAAFLMDRIMGTVGLPGRAFLPLLSSFACAIPGIMATRTIENRNDRLTTIFIAPFMSCSARLPVYALLIGAFFAGKHLGPLNVAGFVLFALYVFGILAAFVVAWLLKRTVLRGGRPLYVMELPPYRIPSWRSVYLTIRSRCVIFVQRAGTVIVAVSIVLWFLAAYPINHPETVSLQTRAATADAFGSHAEASRLRTEAAGSALRHSFAGRIGHAIEPALTPLGFDWRIGIGLLSSIAAREVMVSTMATVYNLDGTADPGASLRETLPKVTNPQTGRPVYTPLVAASLMIFFALACQCMSTVAVARRETNSWRWPILMLVSMNAMAWIVSFAFFQAGRTLGWG
jgi:ferrous iron transport protein B